MADNSDREGPPRDPVIGYARVDAQPDADLLVAGMDATAAWPAVQRLRAWERERLALRPGERVLDVGCGPGDVAVALSSDVGGAGAVTGIDTSEAMLRVARVRADVAGARVDFRIGDVAALDMPDGALDACRSERVLQWVPDLTAAVAELVRVVRPGGRLVLTDTDWHTLVIDIPDRGAADLMTDTILASRGEPARAGGRLVNACRDQGLVEVACTAETHVFVAWDPDTEIGPAGFFPPAVVVPQMVDAGLVTVEDGERMLDAFVDAGRRDRLFMSVTMFAVYGRRPSS